VGENIIEFTPSEIGEIPFTCWMGMIKSKITVIEDINKASN
jgi:plastocyanin domain-containing protein